MRRTHVDLFSGLAGFARAAQEHGVETVQFVENNGPCQRFIAAAYPGVPIHDDIRTFMGSEKRYGSTRRMEDTEIHGGWNERQNDRNDESRGVRTIAGKTSNGGGVADARGECIRPRRTESERQQWTAEASIIDGGVADSGVSIGGQADRIDQSEKNRSSIACVDSERVWLVTGGVPCQPVSHAGKRKGAEDDRWLWPEALRVIERLRPTWTLLENPAGIRTMGLDGILASLESLGYQTVVFSIPACAVNAPHRRERYWIVAHDCGERCEDEREPKHGIKQGSSRNKPDRCTADGRGNGTDASLADNDEGRLRTERESKNAVSDSRAEGFWDDFEWLPCADGKVRRAPPDAFGLVDGLHRSVLAALGNSIVPQVASEIIAAMIAAEEA